MDLFMLVSTSDYGGVVHGIYDTFDKAEEKKLDLEGSVSESYEVYPFSLNEDTRVNINA